MPGYFAKQEVHLKIKPKISKLTKKTAQNPLTEKFSKTKNQQENQIKNQVGYFEKTSQKWAIFFQKHAQYAFSSILKQQKCHKVGKNGNPRSRNLQKTSPKNKQISIETSPKTSNMQVFKKNLNSTKNKPEFAVKPQCWEHCQLPTTRQEPESEILFRNNGLLHQNVKTAAGLLS